MIEWNLTEGEYFFLRVHHYFEFLRLKGYKGNQFSLSGRGERFITFYHPRKKKFITISEKTEGYLDFVVQPKGLFTKAFSFYEETGIKCIGIGNFAEKIRNNEHFYSSI